MDLYSPIFVAHKFRIRGCALAVPSAASSPLASRFVVPAFLLALGGEKSLCERAKPAKADAHLHW